MTDRPEDGGPLDKKEDACLEPAFPVKELCRDCDGRAKVHEWPGISVRDYFAAAALTGLMAGQSFNDAANIAYFWADAMLKARES